MGRVTLDPFAPPPALPRGADTVGGWQELAPGASQGRVGRWREDVPRALVVVAVTVLLGSPAGLLWAVVAPRLRVTVGAGGELSTPDLEASKAFIGADGSYLLVMLGAGILCGVLAWLFARQAGPWTVLALAVGGYLAALVAARVGLQPGSHTALEALRPGSSYRGSFDLFLGARNPHGTGLHLRAPLAAVGWPVGALLAFLVGGLSRPQELD